MSRFLLALLLVASVASRAQMHHLGVAGDPEWEEFRGAAAEGPRFEFVFKVENNTNDWTITLRQRDVKLNWGVQLNGKAFTNLFLSEDDLVNAWVVKPEWLREGTNTLTITPPKERDDIEVGNLLVERGDVLEGAIKIDAGGMPCRITVVNANESLVPLRAEGDAVAARPGVAYLGNGSGTLRLRLGHYRIYAGRGFEFGVVTQAVAVVAGPPQTLKFELKRQVSTPGLVSCDTHVHTFTYSRHGDATAEERAITLAGEGIELPIATDHNVIIDPTAAARKTGMDKYFTAVSGDEVTTGHAHFNIFPVEAGAKAPNYKINDWPELMKEMRAAPAVKVVILNHPRNVHNNFQPFASTNFNAKTGENLRGSEFSFDAVEVLNSSALQSDWMVSFRDWMALLNYGYRVTAVGSSDCHDVSRYIVGQGRSYVACDDSDVSRIDVNKACESILNGRVLVSMGLLADMKVEDRFSVGDLATGVGDMIHVTVSVQGPDWTAADLVQLYANGELAREEHFAPVFAPGEKKRIHWSLPKPPKDLYLVAIASGPPVTSPYWRIPKPYQPTSTTWKPRVVGATNPIWVDSDGDGKFTALRLQARAK
jgi:hypothetical protein